MRGIDAANNNYNNNNMVTIIHTVIGAFGTETKAL